MPSLGNLMMKKETETISSAESLRLEGLRDKAMYTYYTNRIKSINETLCVWDSRRKSAKSLADRDDYAIGMNQLQEKGIRVSFQAAQKLKNPAHKEKFYFECINWGISYYGIDYPSLSFKLLHPKISSMFRQACKGYVDAAKELINNKKCDSENEFRLMHKIVYCENIGRTLSLFHAKRD